jgi:endonuclease/exonuclease/phosphatase family metal-dependent hydrolase
MQIRVVTWNICRKTPLVIWDYLTHSTIPTFCLLQEVYSNDSDSETFLSNRIDNKRGSTAILTNGLSLKKIEVKHVSHPGTITVGAVSLPDGQSLTMISLYGLLDEGYSITTLHRILSDLTPIIDHTKRVIIGGDFNASPQWDERQPGTTSHQILFERLEDFGFTNCLAGKGILQTWRSSHPTTKDFPWQLDYLFASNDISAKVSSCKVLGDDPKIHAFSDHNPVEAVFDL